MPQYLVGIHHPDDYDPSLESEAMSRDIDVLNEEMEAAGARIFAGGLVHPAAAQGRCERSPMVRCLSLTVPTWRLRSTWAVFGYWKPLTWKRRWHGGARLSQPVGRRSRCARFIDGGFDAKRLTRRNHNLCSGGV
jgi:hypothetical protein